MGNLYKLRLDYNQVIGWLLTLDIKYEVEYIAKLQYNGTLNYIFLKKCYNTINNSVVTCGSMPDEKTGATFLILNIKLPLNLQPINIKVAMQSCVSYSIHKYVFLPILLCHISFGANACRAFLHVLQ